MMGGKKMKKALLLLASGCFGLVLWGCAERAAEVVVAQNQPPQLVSLTADRTVIGLGETATITAAAVDLDGDPLTFTWLATAGQIQGSGSQIVWTAPNEWGTQFIRCEVDDGKGGKDSNSLSITAQQDAPPRIISLAVEPSIVRPTGGAATIAAHIVDTVGTGVASAQATVSFGGSALANLDLLRSSGDNRDGDYQATYQVAANSTGQSQTYRVSATSTDGAGHISSQATTTFTVEAIVGPPAPPT
jgi:hypothetical protein